METSVDLKFRLSAILFVLKKSLIVRSALVSIYQTDVTSFSQLSIKYKNFENKLNPDPNPEPNPKPNPEPNPNQIEGENHLKNCVTSIW